MLPPHLAVFILILSSVAQPWLSSNIREQADRAHAEMVHGEPLRSSEHIPAIVRSPSRCLKDEGLGSILMMPHLGGMLVLSQESLSWT